MTWLQRRMLLNGRGPVFQAAGEGEGGAGDAGGAGGGGAGGDAGGAGDAGDKGGGSILDLASKAKPGEAKPGEPGQYTAPDFLPDHLRGKDADETLTKLHTAYKGARDAMAKGRGKLDGDVPEKSDGYTFEDTGTADAPDKIFAELTNEASKPLVSAAQKAAHKMGIPDKAFQGFMREFVASAGESGLPIGMDDGEFQQISGEAEMEKLTELVGSGLEATTLVNTVENYAQKLVSRGTMTKDDLAEFRVMVGTAESAHLFYKILTGELGEKPIPRTVGADGAMTSTEAYAMHARASALPQGSERTQAMEEANRAMVKAHGENSAGSVRSSVF